MTITIFVEPSSLQDLIVVCTMLETLPLDNEYKFDKRNLVFSETQITGYMQINLDIKLYLKLMYCINKL